MNNKNHNKISSYSILHQRLIEIRKKLKKYIEKTKMADEKVYQYSLEAEYLTDLLKMHKKA